MYKKEYIKYIVRMLNNIDNKDVLDLIYRIVQVLYTMD